MVAILTIYPAIMTLDLSRRKKKRMDILCCIKATSAHQKEKIEVVQKNEMLVPPKQPSTKKTVPFQGLLFLESFVKEIYSPFLQICYVKVCILLTFGGLLAVSICGLFLLEQGLELTDVVPKGTAPYSFLDARETYFSFYPMFMVLTNPTDYPHKQDQMKMFRKHIGKSKYIVSNRGKLGQFWLPLMTEYLENVQNKYVLDVKLGHINGTNVTTDVSFEGKLGYKLICNTGEGVNCSRNDDGILLVNNDGNINPVGFYKYLTLWYNLENIMYYISQANFFPTPPVWSHDEKNLQQEIPTAFPPLISQIPFYLNGLVDTPTTVQAIKVIREISENYTKAGLPNFPQGIPFTFFEQYFFMIQNLLTNLAIITICVYVVISILLMSPWAAGIIVSILIMMVIELCGFMGLIGLKLNPISCVSLITAVGIGVEFTVHNSLSFLRKEGTKNQRMALMLQDMFVPVMHGGISTLLGIIVLAFSEFDFIIRYKIFNHLAPYLY